MNTKTCFKCKLEKTLDNYHIDRKNKTGRASYCKECATASSKHWYATSENYRQIVKNSYLKSMYGITQADYFNMLSEQSGVCAICKNKPIGKYLHVDPCHTTGKIRGLLCKNCNHGLGNFKDNLQYLVNAYDYLCDTDSDIKPVS